ncbi:histidine--tRNA ligase [Deferrisoma camini]|uniref:histidine--tRNA ligase n=1 Tax=Deferrisoma camini TaxID=1035120 RepID=UPI00046CB07D|nr:histidine--tRNA ligase [Deferrisoma camini]
MELKKLKGFRDLLPDETPLWQYMEAKARRVLEAFGYREVRLPLLEDTALFRRSIGEATDIVEKEMYTFVDTGGNSVTLRPEGTASAVRAYLENGFARSAPKARWYYLGPMFRRERPQKGRLRQFHQIGVECFGWAEAEADAEVLTLLWDLFAAFGLSDRLRLEINTLGCSADRAAYVQTLRAHLQGLRSDLCPDCQRRIDTNPLRVLDCKKERCRQLTSDAPRITEAVCPKCSEHFARVREILDGVGLAYRVNPRMVRGLDYYNRTTFELLAEGLGAQNAVAAGGRYDGLAEALGGPPVPALGFALGMERLGLLLDPEAAPAPVPTAYWVTRGPEAAARALALRRELAARGMGSAMDLAARSFKAQMRAADRSGARFALILAEDEMASGTVTVKDLSTGNQETVAVGELISYLMGRIATPS